MNKIIMNVIKNEAKSIAKDIIKDKIKAIISKKDIRQQYKKDILNKFGMTIRVIGDRDRTRIKYSRIIKWIKKNIDIKGETIYTSSTIPFKDYTFKYRESMLFISHIDKGEKYILELHILSKNKEKSIEVYDELLLIIKGEDEDLNKQSSPYFPMYICSGDGIDDRILIQKRNKETIFSDKFNLIINDIEKFMTKREIYENHGLPFKTGLFLYGRPGTGKSSIIKAIASYFCMPIYNINLTELSYVDFKKIVYDINGKCRDRMIIVLLEEIDLSNSGASLLENDKDKKISLLLNWLDGQLSPHNVVFISTTNYIDKVDERIKRSGRFDYRYEIGYISEQLAINMCNSFKVDCYKILSNPELNEFKEQDTYSPSKVQELILKEVVNNG